MARPKINHVLHLILTLVTFGVWGIVWVVLAIGHGGKLYRCTQCGTPLGHGQAAAAARTAVPPERP